VRRITVSIFSIVLIASHAHAQTRPRATNYQIPTDVQAVGGGEAGKSTNYILDDTIGESNIGFGRSNTYDLNAGYRQTTDAFLSLSCGGSVALGSISATGQITGSGTCLVATDADAGYALSWRVTTGSGGTSTGYMISENEDVIAPFNPAIAGTPQTWSVSATDSRWGARLRSSSTDTDAKWGADGSSDAWLNVGTGSYTVVARATRTSVAGSSEILQFRAEIGASKVQPPGTYQTTVEMTATSL
jgi:hypothetical protein